MKRLWRWVSAIGFSEALSKGDQKRLVVINQISAIFIAISFIRSIFFFCRSQLGSCCPPVWLHSYSSSFYC